MNYTKRILINPLSPPVSGDFINWGAPQAPGSPSSEGLHLSITSLKQRFHLFGAELTDLSLFQFAQVETTQANSLER